MQKYTKIAVTNIYPERSAQGLDVCFKAWIWLSLQTKAATNMWGFSDKRCIRFQNKNNKELQIAFVSP